MNNKNILVILVMITLLGIAASYDGFSRFDNVWVRGYLNVTDNISMTGDVFGQWTFNDPVFFLDNVTVVTPLSLEVNNTLSIKDTSGVTQIFLNASGDSWFNVSGGRVGIGTANPTALLQLEDDTFNKLILNRTSANGNNIVFANTGGTLGSIGALDGDELTFRIGGSAVGDTVMLIDSSGNVGIGTTSPSTKLDVAGNLNISSVVYSRDNAGNWIEFDDDGGGASNSLAIATHSDIINILDSNDNTVNGVAFRVMADGASSSTATEIFRIMEGGNVGIGTTVPSARLAIVGNDSRGYALNVSNAMYVNTTSGRVGIGTIAPDSELHIKNFAGTGNADLVFESSDGNKVDIGRSSSQGSFVISSGTSLESSQKFIINMTNGNVGINVAVPDTKLTINQSIDNEGIKIYAFDDQSTEWGHLYMTSDGRLNIDSSIRTQLKSGGATLGFFDSGTLQVNDEKRLQFGGNADFSIGYTDGADTWRLVNSTDLTPDGAGEAVFIEVDKAGRVGIGAITPNKKLVVVGNSNITGNLTVGVNADGHLHVGNVDPNSLGSGDFFASGHVYANKSLTSVAREFGVGVIALNSGTGANITSSGDTGSLNVTTGFVCDTNDPFNTGHDGKWITTLSSSPVNYLGLTGEITDFVNSTCVVISLASTGDNILTDASTFNYIVYDHPIYGTLDNGFLSFDVGVHPDTVFEVHIDNGTGDHGVLIEDVAGRDSHQSLAIETDGYNFDGVVGINNLVFSSIDVVGKSMTNLFLEADGSNVTNSSSDFIAMRLVGQPTNTMVDGIDIDPQVTHIIHMGSADVLNSSYYNNVNVTENFSTVNGVTEVFINDGDIIYIGSSTNFTDISFSLTIESSQNIAPIYYYCNLSKEYEILTGITDTTDGFKTSGTISFLNPSNRGTCNNETDGTQFSDPKNYTYIAIERTANTVVTPPVVDFVSISGGSELFLLQKDMLMLKPITAPPETCSAAFAGALYYDTDLNKHCSCDSTNWVQINDYSTVCS